MSLEFAILGFLNYQPYSGYDLKKIFDTSVRHFWPADQSQIYRTLEMAPGMVFDSLLPGEDIGTIDPETRAYLTWAWSYGKAPIEDQVVFQGVLTMQVEARRW
jgi:hypothetical protein